MTVRALLFDLWGTLIADPPGASAARAQLRARRVAAELDAIRRPVDLAVIERAFEVAGDEHSKIHARGLDLSAEGRTILYLRHLDPEIAPSLDEDGWRRMHAAILTPALEIPPAPLEGALDGLRAAVALGVPTALVSNAGLTPGFVLRDLLDGFGMLEHLHVPIFSDEVELAKPAAGIFAHALDALDVEPQHAAFIGDQPVLDVLGPQSAGIWSIQVGDLAEDGIEPDARIDALPQLIPALRTLGLLG